MAYANFQSWRGRLGIQHRLLWVLMLAFPFPYIANTLGWMTAELGRQPWLVYGLFRTRDGYSKVVSNGDTIFTLIGFTGLYFVLGLLFLYLVGRQIGHGPDEDANRQDDLSRTTATGIRESHCHPVERPCLIATWYAVVSLMLIILCGFGRAQFRRRNAPLAGRQHARRTATGRRGYRATLVLARSMARRLWRHAGRGFSTAHGLGFCRLLPGAVSDFVVSDSARDLLEVAGHINDTLWQGFWDFVFVSGNFLLAILSVLRQAIWSGVFRLMRRAISRWHFFTTFSDCAATWVCSTGTRYPLPSSRLYFWRRWCDLSDAEDRRSGARPQSQHARFLWAALVLLFPVITVESWVVRPDLFDARLQSTLLVGAVGQFIVSIIALISGLVYGHEMLALPGLNASSSA